MKLKYNIDGSTESIPLATRKKPGKRLAIHQDGQNYYAPVVPADDPKASKLPVGVNGEVFAVQAQEPPEISAVNVAPSSVAVMQGQSATATVTALTNDAVTGLSYGLSGAPTWITISDDLILIQPSDNDLGIANVQVYAQDTGSDAMSSAILRAEAKLRPIIESLSVIPPAVTVQQGQSAVATVSAVANEAVMGLSYSIDGSPAWVTLADDSIVVAPTDNDTGNAVMTVFAYDTNSSASAATTFNATATLRPIISSVSVNPPTVAAVLGESTEATISAVANEAVTGLSYSLDGAPSWMNLSGSVIVMTPADTDSGSAAVTVTAHDTGSTAHASTVFTAQAKKVARITDIFLSNDVAPNAQSLIANLSYEGNDLVTSVSYTATTSAGRVSINGSTFYFNHNVVGTVPCTITAKSSTDSASLSKVFNIKVKYALNLYAGSTSSYNVATEGNSIQTMSFPVTINSYSKSFPSSCSLVAEGAIPVDATITPTFGKRNDTSYSGSAMVQYATSKQSTYSGSRERIWFTLMTNDDNYVSIANNVYKIATMKQFSNYPKTVWFALS